MDNQACYLDSDNLVLKRLTKKGEDERQKGP